MKTLQQQLKEHYPNVKLDDRFNMRLELFTAEDMIEFAIAIQQEQQKVIAENAKVEIKVTINENPAIFKEYTNDGGSIKVYQSSIINENNIIK